MGKWALYKKKHKKEWEELPLFRGWLTNNPESNKEGSNSYCKVCSAVLRSHKGDLDKHAHTVKHKQQMSKLSNTQPIKNMGINVSNVTTKKKELILSTYVAMHTSIRSVDHLSDIFVALNKASASSSQANIHEGDVRLHKTKCTAIIKNVIGPSIFDDLIKDVGDSQFSIIVDESTDVSTDKLLCVIIRYYSEKRNDILNHFLTFLSVTQTTAQDLYDVIVKFFEESKLNLRNLIGIGTDGASNLCGSHHSLYTLLKRNFNLNNLILVKCICHSLHLCSSKASEVFANEIDFLLRETYNWFRNSALRLSKYKEIYGLINAGTTFTKFTQLSSTRWLAHYCAVNKILQQYLELETFFNISAGKERCHTAKVLHELYKNKQHKLILIFLRPILKQMYSLNLYFQKQSIDYYRSFEEVNTTIWSLARQIIKPVIIAQLQNSFDLLLNCLQFENNLLNLDDCDFGYEFGEEIRKTNLKNETILDIKKKCLNFIIVLLQQMIKRMPDHLEIFRQGNHLSPKLIINPKREKFSGLPLQLADSTKLGDIEIQYRNLLNINWNDIFGDDIPDDSIAFWKKVITLQNAAGEYMFRDIAHFAFTMYTLPASNAIVERNFSLMNIIKNKLRNQMQLQLLNAIMLIKSNFFLNNICCKDFVPTSDMLSKFTSNMYNISNPVTADGDDDDLIDSINNL